MNGLSYVFVILTALAATGASYIRLPGPGTTRYISIAPYPLPLGPQPPRNRFGLGLKNLNIVRNDSPVWGNPIGQSIYWSQLDQMTASRFKLAHVEIDSMGYSTTPLVLTSVPIYLGHVL